MDFFIFLVEWRKLAPTIKGGEKRSALNLENIENILILKLHWRNKDI